MDLSGALQHRFTRDVWSTRSIIAMETESFICSWYFLPLLWVCFLLFSSLAIVKAASGSFMKQMLPIKSPSLPARKEMASYWKQYVMVIAVLLQVMPLKNVRDLFSSNWWWGKAQLKRKWTVALSITQLQTPSYKCLVCCVHSCVYSCFKDKKQHFSMVLLLPQCWSHK